VILAAAWQGRQRRRAERPHLPPSAGLWAGFVSGTLTTSISISGPPMVLWLEARGVEPAEFRTTLAATFLALNLVGGAVLLGAEGTGGLELGDVALLLVLVIAGYALGAAAFRRLDHDRFFTIALVLVAGTGVASVVAGLS
jgi:hypothetical protein